MLTPVPLFRQSAALTLLLLAACGGDGSSVAPTPLPPEPVVRRDTNAVLVTTVGTAVVFDPTGVFTIPEGVTPTTTVTVSGVPGLSGSAGALRGTPSGPGVGTVIVRLSTADGAAVADTFPVVAFAAGLATPELPAQLFGYSDASRPLPAHFRAFGAPGGAVVAADNTPPGNATTDAGATLGRVLFHDRRLSRTDGVACASCHVQSAGFTDTLRFSVGHDGRQTPRHSMSLGNARFYARGRFFWDERAATLEAQVLEPISDPIEMALSIEDALTKLRATPYYAPLFTAAFGSPDVTADRVARALAQFVRAMVTAGAKHDQAFAAGGPPNFAGTFTPQELEGFQLFTGPAGCARCHNTEAQLAPNVFNNGLDATITDAGAGEGRFKAPSLRNVGVRRFFMHDGRFTSLEQVVAHYDSGIRVNPGLDPRLRGPGGQPQRLNLSAGQRAALVAYLHTLTDSAFLSDPRLGDPFRR
jgi:cytochrome c peroxidase